VADLDASWLESATVADLLAGHAKILATLRHERKIVRSNNAPVGDYAELLVARALGGVLGTQSTKAWDVIADDRHYQVKSRTASAGAGAKPRGFSPFRSAGDESLSCTFITFDEVTLDVVNAVQVPSTSLDDVLAPVPHVGTAARRLPAKVRLAELPGAETITEQLRAAQLWVNSAKATPEAIARYYPAPRMKKRGSKPSPS
jgi:hypothetical protein